MHFPSLALGTECVAQKTAAEQKAKPHCTCMKTGVSSRTCKLLQHISSHSIEARKMHLSEGGSSCRVLVPALLHQHDVLREASKGAGAWQVIWCWQLRSLSTLCHQRHHLHTTIGTVRHNNTNLAMMNGGLPKLMQHISIWP